MQKQVERMQVDIQRFTQDAQQEIQDLQNQLQQQFEQRIEPILAQVGQEKGLHFIFNGPDSGLVWADPGLDISADVIKKLDATPAARSRQSSKAVTSLQLPVQRFDEPGDYRRRCEASPACF